MPEATVSRTADRESRSKLWEKISRTKDEIRGARSIWTGIGDIIWVFFLSTAFTFGSRSYMLLQSKASRLDHLDLTPASPGQELSMPTLAPQKLISTWNPYEEFPVDDNGIIEMNLERYEKAKIESQKWAFLVVLVPGRALCAACEVLAPTLSMVAREMRRSETTAYIAKVDAEDQNILAKKLLEISDPGSASYPSLVLVKDGRTSKYQGHTKSARQITTFLKRSVKLVLLVLPAGTCEAKISQLRGTNEVVVVGNWKHGTRAAELYTAAFGREAEKTLNLGFIQFAICPDEEFAASFGQHAPVILLFHSRRKKISSFIPRQVSGSASQSQLIHASDATRTFDAWLHQNIMLPVNFYDSPDKSSIIFGHPHRKHMILFLDNPAQSMSNMQKLLLDHSLIKEDGTTRNGDTFITTICPSDEHELMDVFKVNASETPALRIVDWISNTTAVYKYEESDDVTDKEAVRRWVRAYHNKELSRLVKSEPIPSGDAHPFGIRTLVGNTFHKEVIRSSEDVLVAFFAPWCAHCKLLMPVYEGLGKILINIESLKIAKIDKTKNEIDHPANLKIRSYPTFYFFPSKNKTAYPKQVSANNGLAGFLYFLRKHGSEETQKGLNTLSREDLNQKGIRVPHDFFRDHK